MGYLDMLEKDFTQAMTDLEYASKIESTCLIPNGHKPSVYLHNNFAMLHFKRREFRKALAHYEKCRDQIETVKKIEAVMIHYNFAMTNKELYFYELALKHFAESRRLLQKLDEEYLFLYERKIDLEIEKLNNMRIIEDSEESSYGARQSFSSKYSSNPKNI